MDEPTQDPRNGAVRLLAIFRQNARAFRERGRDHPAVGVCRAHHHFDAANLLSVLQRESRPEPRTSELRVTLSATEMGALDDLALLGGFTRSGVIRRMLQLAAEGEED